MSFLTSREHAAPPRYRQAGAGQFAGEAAECEITHNGRSNSEQKLRAASRCRSEGFERSD
jgi:hypothetical protein